MNGLRQRAVLVGALLAALAVSGCVNAGLSDPPNKTYSVEKPDVPEAAAAAAEAPEVSNGGEGFGVEDLEVTASEVVEMEASEVTASEVVEMEASEVTASEVKATLTPKPAPLARAGLSLAHQPHAAGERQSSA